MSLWKFAEPHKEMESEVTQLCWTLVNPMNWSLPGSAIREIFQIRILEWVAISFSSWSSLPRYQTQVSCTASRLFTIWATREVLTSGRRKGVKSTVEHLSQFSSVQMLSVWLFVIPWTAACQASLSITNSQSLLKLMSIHSVMPSNYLILSHLLILLSSIFSSIRVFFSESVLHIRWPKYWSFSFNISPSNEHSILISFRMPLLDLLAVQGTLKSLLQHNSKASILWHSAFFVVQLSHPYMTTGKSIALTGLTLVGRVMSLCLLICYLGWS